MVVYAVYAEIKLLKILRYDGNSIDSSFSSKKGWQNALLALRG